MIENVRDRASRGRETLVGWSAVSAAMLSLFAWASCCVLPMVLSLAGLTLTGSGVIAGQRTPITLIAALLLAGGWVLALRRARRCRLDAACAAPSRVTIWLLALASVLVLASLLWAPLIEPVALRSIAAWRR